MPSPRVLILRAPGTNCDLETAHAFSMAGAAPDRVHVNRLIAGDVDAAAYQILCIPGGFSYGDDIAAGRIFAVQLRQHLSDLLHGFHAADKLILGICNGFQVLIKTGLLVADDAHGPLATLTDNDAGIFQDRWVHLRVAGGRCVFLAGIDALELPIAHGEGKFVTRDPSVFARLADCGQLVLRYDDPAGRGDASPAESGRSAAETDSASHDAARILPFPANPNGSQGDVAGICDESGRVLGLMPHPERFVDATQHPRWTRGPKRDVGDGLRVFQNAVRYFL